ncbi:hypothetical protein ATKI12_3384 [Kitasatospora sp. Ki12]
MDNTTAPRGHRKEQHPQYCRLDRPRAPDVQLTPCSRRADRRLGGVVAAAG